MNAGIYRQRYTSDELEKRKKCPLCGRWQKYKTLGHLLEAQRNNTNCRSCAGKNISEESRKKLSQSLKKSWTKKRRLEQSKRIRYQFQKYTLAELIEIRNRQSQAQKIAFPKWKKNYPERYAAWRRNLKLAFKKYRWDNHWMKRPEVLQKIRNSCAIYRNGGHWFHTNPESLKKLIETQKRKKLSVF